MLWAQEQGQCPWLEHCKHEAESHVCAWSLKAKITIRFRNKCSMLAEDKCYHYGTSCQIICYSLALFNQQIETGGSKQP